MYDRDKDGLLALRSAKALGVGAGSRKVGKECVEWLMDFGDGRLALVLV